jgi:diguanylate cyclase (GGDEF)-like protein
MKRTTRERHEDVLEIDERVAAFIRDADEAGVPLPEGLTEMLRERQEHTQDLFRRVSTDAKSGVATPDMFVEEARQHMERKNGGYATLVIFDMDRFKALNDSLGHAAGDMAIGRMGRVLRRSLRSSDYAGRFGGDEFVVYSSDGSADAGLIIAERVYRGFEAEKQRTLRQLDRVGAPETTKESVRDLTLSGGISVGHDYDGMFADADTALYDAKKDGRNRAYMSTGRLQRPEWLPRGYILSEDVDTVSLYRMGSVVNGRVGRTERIGTFAGGGATQQGILDTIRDYTGN